MYHKFRVSLRFRDKSYAGLPANQEIVKKYVKAKFDSDDTTATETDLDLEEKMEENLNRFRRDKDDDASTGLIYMHAYQLNALISQNASLLEYTTSKRGSKQTFAEGLTIRGLFPSELTPEAREFYNHDKDDKETSERFFKTRTNIDVGSDTGPKLFFGPGRVKADGVEDFVGTVTDAAGKRSILKSNEYVKNARVDVEIWILSNRVVKAKNSNKIMPEHLYFILFHGQVVGLGSNRKLYGGHYDLLKFEDLGVDKSIQYPL